MVWWIEPLASTTSPVAAWIAASLRSAFFFSAFTEASAGGNGLVMRRLAARDIDYSTSLPKSLSPGVVDFVSTPGLDHDDYMTQAWVNDPMAWLLSRIPGYPRR